MIDPAGVIQGPLGDYITSLLVCRSYQRSLANGVRRPESLANYRWIGAVPPQLQGLTWIEELLIVRSHLTGHIVRLQNRNATSYFGLKGHVILLPPSAHETPRHPSFSSVVITRYRSRRLGWQAFVEEPPL